MTASAALPNFAGSVHRRRGARLPAALVFSGLVAAVGPPGTYEMPQVSSSPAAFAGSSLIL